jgi:hypothetical protein
MTNPFQNETIAYFAASRLWSTSQFIGFNSRAAPAQVAR